MSFSGLIFLYAFFLLCFFPDVTQTSDSEDNLNELNQQREENNGVDAIHQDLDFIVRPNMTHWEQLLLPAPTVVSLLGQMVVLSSKIDLSLTNVEPKDGWKFVQNPQSLRACLIQIGHKAWDAFRLAQRNMDEVQLTMAMVPRHLQSAVKIIKTQPPRLVNKLLPKTLERISEAAILSENLVVDTEKAFVNVMGLTEEIERTVAAAQGVKDQEIVENSAKMTYTDALLHKVNETAELAKKTYNTISTEVAKAREEYEKAVRDIPTGWKALGMDLVRAVGGIIKNLSQGIGSFLGGMGSGGGIIGGIKGNGGSGSTPELNQAAVKDTIILNAATLIQPKLSELLTTFDSIDDKKADHFRGLKVELQTFLKMFASYPNTYPKQTAIPVYTEAVDILQSLETAAQGATPLDEKAKVELKERTQAVVNRGKMLVAAAVESGSSMTASTSGGGNVARPEGNSDYDNEKYILNIRQEQLQSAEKRLDESFERLVTMNREMAQIEADLAGLNITNINLKDIRNLLNKVIVILGKIREQWNSLVEFFQLVAVRATVINRDIIRPFLNDTADITEDMKAEERTDILNYVLDLAVDVNSASLFLHTITKTYVDVSHQYLLKKLAGLSQLLGAESDAERERLRGQLESDAQQAREGIHQLIQGLRESYKNKLNERKQQLIEYERSLSPLIGSGGNENAAAIEQGRRIAQTVGVVLPDNASV